MLSAPTILLVLETGSRNPGRIGNGQRLERLRRVDCGVATGR